MRSDKITGGLFLIGLGVVFLLLNLGFISWSILSNIIQLWPLVLVVVGINIIAKNNPIVKGITWLLFLIIFIGYGYLYGGGISLKSSGHTMSTSKMEETTTGKVNIDFGGTKLNINAINRNLIEANANNSSIKPQIKYSNDNSHVTIDLKGSDADIINFGNNTFDYNISLNKQVVWDIEADLGAVSGNLDLSELKVDSLALDLGASNLKIYLGDKHTATEINMNAGASNLELIIPQTLGMKVKVDGLISKTSLNKLGWQQENGYYISPNYAEATSKTVVNIDLGVGKLDIEVK